MTASRTAPLHTAPINASPHLSTELTTNIVITRICGQRDEAIRLVRRAAGLIREGHILADAAAEVAANARNGANFSLRDRAQDTDYQRLFERFDFDASTEMFRKHTDACVWLRLLRETGMENLMDAKARDEFFHKNLGENVIEVNEDNVSATLQGFRETAKLIFQRGLAETFSRLDKRFKSHDAFKIGSRIILTHAFDQYGSWNHWSRTTAEIKDVERVLAILSGKTPNPGALVAAIDASRTSYGPRQGTASTEYLTIRTFKNGNAHLWFTDPKLVEKLNLVLADYYGQVLPDAVGPAETLRVKSGLPAKDLSFYATPSEVVDKMLSVHEFERVVKGSRILEPSAGTGNIARGLLAKGFKVDAVEIHPGRCAELRMIRGLSVTEQNFLQMKPVPIYDAVVMNPPFSGVHWIDHVLHAYEFLAPGGVLVSVLPATAELGDTKRHEDFRTWALAKTRHKEFDALCRPLPGESFIGSGTRINTLIFTMRKDQ